MRFFSPFFILLTGVLSSCYTSLTLDGFETASWKESLKDCNEYRLKKAAFLIENKEPLMGATQNEIESLLGKAEEHELYERNQKFFHYRLTPYARCGTYEIKKFLLIRFNAIGRANDVQITIRE